jgi:hypothetical protein
MKKSEIIFGLAFFTLFLGALIVVGLTVAQFGLNRIKQALDGLDSQTGIVLGVSAIVAFLCSALIGGAIRSAKRREVESHLHNERVALYHAIIESLVVLVSETSACSLNGRAELLLLENALFLRGSVTVNNEYRVLLRLLSDPGVDEKDLRTQISRFLVALRRDCGQSASGLAGQDWSELLLFPARQVASERSAGSAPAQFTDPLLPRNRVW